MRRPLGVRGRGLGSMSWRRGAEGYGEAGGGCVEPARTPGRRPPRWGWASGCPVRAGPCTGELSGQVDVGLGAWGILAADTLLEAPRADKTWPRPSWPGDWAAQTGGYSQRVRDGGQVACPSLPGVLAAERLSGQLGLARSRAEGAASPRRPCRGPWLRGSRSELAPAASPHSAAGGPELRWHAAHAPSPPGPQSAAGASTPCLLRPPLRGGWLATPSLGCPVLTPGLRRVPV